MQLYRNKLAPLSPHTIIFPFKGITAPPSYVLTPRQCLSTGEYRDISPTPEPGYQLGTVPTWDEVAGTVTMNVAAIPAASLLTLKQTKLDEIKQAFNNEMYKGKTDTTLGWEVDARRAGLDNDLQNIETLHRTMVANNETSTYIKGADNALHSCTMEEVALIITKISVKGLWNYQHKHLLEMQVDQAATAEELNAINW